MRAEQTVNEMADEVLMRQAKAQAQRTGQPLVEAREAVLQTPAGMQLEELRGGVHQHEEVRYWQANLLFERVSEQAGHPVGPDSTGLELRPFS
jgi:plasmid stabilization system protein ParE